MCILFVYSGEDDSNCDYSLIIATNRDESFKRPALPASFWAEDHTVIGGRDMEKGREGGTWLALSTRTGKLGVLLNLTGNPKINAKGRGNIVADYVKRGDSMEEYVKQLEPDRKLYNDFTLVTVEIGKSQSKVQCYNNTTNKLLKMKEAYSGFSNSLYNVPYKKVVAGRDRFRTICEKWAKEETQNELVDNLVELLRWKEKHLPDKELLRRAPNWYENLSSVFVSHPEENYGSRAHTIILVKKNGETEFIETSLSQPIDANNPQWQTARHSFKLNII